MKKIVVMLSVMFALVLTGNTAMASDVELIGGGGVWSNNLAKGDYLYGEGMMWIDGEHSFGFGAYGMIDSGESEISAYTWDGWNAGPQIGYKRTWFDESNLMKQVQLKLRYVWEHTEGSNSESGYKMEQDSTKLGLYGEYVSRLDYKWQVITIAEAWKTLSKEKTSSAVGDDEVENRDQYSAGIFGQYKVSNPLSIRAGASLFYQGWDEMTGVRVQGEVRLFEHVMVGAYVSVPFSVPEMYADQNAEASDLVTTGFFGRVEF